MSTKSTRIALVASLTALVLCVAMLIGTTFAWFTDNVSTAKNNIVAGKLDLELEYMNAEGKWETLEDDTSIFNDAALWEPGYTEVAYLRVKNAGTLAFDYSMGVNIVSETAGKNVEDKEFKLSDYIYMGAVEDASTAFASREAARAAVTGAKAISDGGYTKVGTLKAAEVKCVALVVYMPETVGNVANYRGATVPTIELGINVLATQETYESDDFGKDYDENASTTAPSVPVTKETVDIAMYDFAGTGMPTDALKGVDLDVYDFTASDYQSVYPRDEYGTWLCDFYVSTDAPLKDGTILAGNYGTFGWIGFWAPASDKAYAPKPLLGTMADEGISDWTYADICDDVQNFQCGIFNHEEYSENDGVKATVELRMINPKDHSDFITVSSITVTLD